jgi:predicted transcriptional regulator
MTKISAVIPDDLNVALRQRARAEDRSVGAVVRRAIAEHVRAPVKSRTTAHAVRRNTGAQR